MNALDLEMEKLPEFADQISSAAQNSNASIAEMGDALLSVGGYAKQLAGGTTELTTGLGVLADAMIKGSEGGTSLRNIIRALASPEDGAAKVLKELGVSAYDATTGAFRPLNETLGDLDAALSKLNPEKRAQQMSKIFNAFDLNAAEVLMASTSADGRN
jgi:TP901 family phage tail tape measure protein